MDRRHFIAGGTTVLAGCATMNPQAQVSADEYAIFNAITEMFLRGTDVKLVSALDKTLTLEKVPLGKIYLGTDGALAYALDKHKDSLDQSLIDELYSTNQKPAPIDLARMGRPFTDLLSIEDKDLVLQNSYDRFNMKPEKSLPANLRKFKASRYFIAGFSRFAFNTERSKAIGVIEATYGANEDGAELVLAEQAGSVWRTTLIETLWVT